MARSNTRRAVTTGAATIALAAMTGCSVALPGTTDAPPASSLPSHAKMLTNLDVAPEHASTDYTQDSFDYWEQVGPTGTIPDNCDAREAILFMHGTTNVDVDNACEPTAGSWTGAYTGTVIHDDSKVDMDHLVPREEAWLSGADTWPDGKRTEFANDLSNLRISTRHANRSKGSQDPAEWMPKLHKCRYAASWIAIKKEYGLSIDQAEKSALTSILANCSN